LYGISLLSGQILSSWNFASSEWLLQRAVIEADFGAVTDNRINSRDVLQHLYAKYGHRADYKRIDAQIKTIKSEWLASKLSVKMSDEDNLSTELLEKVQVPSDAVSARTIASNLTALASKSLKRGAYKLALAQSQKALLIWDGVLHEHDDECFQSLEVRSSALERLDDLDSALEAAKRSLKWASTDPRFNRYTMAAQLTLARIELVKNNSKDAESWFKQAIAIGKKSGADCNGVMKDALFDYDAFLRRFNRQNEAAEYETYLDRLEKDAPKAANDRTNQ